MDSLASQNVKLGRAEDRKMTIQEALDRCLDEIHSGGATVEECLAEYPQYARELGPLLRTAARLESTDGVRPTRAFKSRLRRQLPGQEREPRRTFFSRPFVICGVLILIVLGFAVWLGISFEADSHPRPQPLPVNYGLPATQIYYIAPGRAAFLQYIWISAHMT